MNNKKILFVDDNKDICTMIETYVKVNKINAKVESRPLNVINILEEESFDIIVLDVAMPGIDGFELFKIIKAKYDIPTLFLSAKIHEIDRIEGLRMGAEDYIIKPFSLDELFLKIHIILSRINTHKINIDDFTFNFVKQEVFYKGKELKITKKSYQLLYLLTSNKGVILSRKEILKKVWGYEEYLDDRTIDTHIKEIRKKLCDDVIKTIRSKGYMYENN